MARSKGYTVSAPLAVGSCASGTVLHWRCRALQGAAGRCGALRGVAGRRRASQAAASDRRELPLSDKIVLPSRWLLLSRGLSSQRYVHSCTSKAIDGHVGHCASKSWLVNLAHRPVLRITPIRLYFILGFPCVAALAEQGAALPLQGAAGRCRALQGAAGRCRALRGAAGRRRASQGVAGRCK